MSRRAWVVLATAFVLACLAWSAVQLVAMRRDPHPVASRLYASGGLARLVSVLATDTGPVPVRAAVTSRIMSKAWSGGVPPAPSLVLVTIRSARADRVPSALTPNLAALAERSVRFDRAFVTLASPRPTWATWMTGRFPHAHGVVAEHVDAAPLGVSVAGILGQAGYDTRAYTDGAPSRFRDLAFADVREAGSPRDPRQLAGTVAKAIRDARGPFFYAVSFDVAAPPHATTAPFYRLARGPYRGRFKYAGPRDANEAVTLDDDEAHVSALYDAALTAADDALVEVVDAAASSGAYLIITSEHGQTLFERGRGETHAELVEGEEANHVPLFVAGAGLVPRHVEDVVRDVDFAPTMLALLGRSELRDVDGASFVGALRGQALDARFAYEESDPGSSMSLEASRIARQRAVHDGRWKLVVTPTRRGDVLRLFDLDADPGATRDVSDREPDVVERLSPLLDAYRRAGRRTAPHADVLWIATSSLPAGVTGTRFDAVWPASTDPDAAFGAALAGALTSSKEADAPSLERDARDAGMDVRTFANVQHAVAFVEGPHRDRRFAVVRSTERIERLPTRADLVVVVTADPPAKDVPEAGAALLVAPGRPTGGPITLPVRAVDLAPTVAEVLGLEPHPATIGESLLPLLAGTPGEPRPVVVVDRRARWLVWGRHRLRVSARRADVFDADGHAVVGAPDLVAELRARLEAAERGVSVAGSEAALGPDEEGARVRLRFAGAGAARRVSGHVDVQGGAPLRVEPSALGRDAFVVRGSRIELSFTTSPESVVGIDVVLGAKQANVGWQLYLDDRPWPREAVFGGPAGLPSSLLGEGVVGREARDAARGRDLAVVDPARELGLFVVRTPSPR